MQNEQGKKRKVLYILLALLAAISMWIYADEFGNNGGHRLIEKTITDIPVNYNGEIKLADRGLMLLEDETTTTLDVTVKGGRRQVSRLEQDDLDVHVSRDGEDELGQLAEEFNHMVQALKANRQELVENQRELNQAQVRMLQAQLNPHFLCNTLDTMKWISKINHVPQVALMSTNLADILRFCISAEEFVPLAREVEVLNRYVEIQKIRLSDQFTFLVSLPEKLETCMVPKMILQPIVENAILHGLEGVPDSVIQVCAEQDGEDLRITVTDNGHGLPPEMIGHPYKRESAPTGHHLGLYNVDTILKKHYGEQYGLYLDNNPAGSGARVRARLPLRRKEEKEC